MPEMRTLGKESCRRRSRDLAEPDQGRAKAARHLEHDPKKCMAFFLATNARRLRGDHAHIQLLRRYVVGLIAHLFAARFRLHSICTNLKVELY